MSHKEFIDPTAPQRFNDIALGIHLLSFEIQQKLAKFLATKKNENGLLPAEYEHILDVLANMKNDDLQYELAIECEFHQLHHQIYFCKETSPRIKAGIASNTKDFRIISDAVKNEDTQVRAGLASNQNLSSEILTQLSIDSEQSVLLVLAANVLRTGDEKPKNLNYHVVRNLILRLKNERFVESLKAEFPQTIANAREVTTVALAKIGFGYMP